MYNNYNSYLNPVCNNKFYFQDRSSLKSPELPIRITFSHLYRHKQTQEGNFYSTVDSKPCHIEKGIAVNNNLVSRSNFIYL